MEDEISLRELLGIVYKGKKIVAIITIVFIVGSIILNSYLEPTYQATALLSVKPSTIKSSTGDELIIDSYVGMPQINIENIEIQAKSPAVLEKMMKNLKTDSPTKTVTEISSKVSVFRQTGKNIIQITVKDSDPDFAARLANGLSEDLIDYVNKEYDDKVLQTKSSMQEQIRKGKEEVIALMGNNQLSSDTIMLEDEIELNSALTKLNVYNEKYALIEINQAINDNVENISIISPAAVPVIPSSPNKALNSTVGIISGLLLGALMVIIRHYIGQIKQKEN